MASLADAEEALRSTSAKANFQRLTRLLMCGGLRLLRETFDSIHSPADLPLKLGDPTIQTQLRGARLTQPERDCLNPSPGVYGKSTDFDITLIFKLLRTICHLTPPPGPRGWDDLPNNSDHSLVADLVRIKYYRNGVYGHSKKMEITDTEFNDLWGKISEILIRIAAAISHEKKDEWKKSIDDYLHKPLTPEEERYKEELNTWWKQDMEVKTEVEKLTEKVETMEENMKEGFARQSQRHPEVIINIVNIVESTTRTGSSGRPQIPHKSGDSQGICAISVSDQEGMDDASDCEELQLRDTPTEIHIWAVILSFKKSVELLFQYLGYTLRAFVRTHDVGSLLITVECSSLQILQGLWEDYRSGHLNAITQEILVTAEVLEKLGLDEVRLKTFISEEEYEKGKQIFMDHSAISGESRLPPGDAAAKSASQIEAGKAAVSEFAPGDVPRELTMPIQKEKDTGDDSGHEPDVKEAAKEKFTKTESVESEWLASQRKPELETLPLAVASTTSIPSASSEGYLERISILEEENRELKRRLIAIEDKLKGNKESKKIQQLEMKNIQLEERLDASENTRELSHSEVQGIKDRVDYLEERFGAGGFWSFLRGSLARASSLWAGNEELRKIQQLEERLDASESARRLSYSEVQEIKYRVDYLEERFNAVGFQSFRDVPFLTIPSRPRFLGEPVMASVYGAPSDRIKGFCQVVVNRQKLEGLDEEREEFKSVFKDLGFDVDEKVCELYDDVERVMNSVAGRNYRDYNRFICFIQSNVTKDGEMESFFGRSLSVTKLLAKFKFLEFSSRREAPKIFIIQGHQTTTALEADEPVDEKSVSMKLPVGETLCLFFPYRKGYIATLLSIIKLHGSKRRDILYILSEAKKLFYEKNHITIPDPVHNLKGPVYLN